MYLFPGGVVRYVVASAAIVVMLLVAIVVGFTGTLSWQLTTLGLIQLIILAKATLVPIAKLDKGFLSAYPLALCRKGPSPLRSVSTVGWFRKAVFTTDDFEYSSLLLVMRQKEVGQPMRSLPLRWVVGPTLLNGTQERVAMLIAQSPHEQPANGSTGRGD